MPVFKHTAHKELWYWLADHPGARREDWPGWENYQDTEDMFGCFACEYSYEAGSDDCELCPLEWPGGMCANLTPTEEDSFTINGLFDKYLQAMREHKPRLISLYARQIAELPVNEGVETI